ncbi:Phosphatidylinositol transfer protein sfh5 [Orchesella cincta]|uniref:Phosphatidylinositol transfer protein sfh5 n=1 Tax=Orchesella cincta TaxID=48709 RepID=A0A1D2NAW5_ORCCI|nr:Phosphatidylinositol transfer protein sfh5 [Orchesella cincta]
MDGYTDFPSDFSCNSEGGVNFPPEDLNGEVGFWTKCGTVCKITYQVQPEDTKISLRFYQMKLSAMISFDGETTIISGDSWVEFSYELTGSGIREVIVTLEHFASDYYTLLDKIVVNGDLSTTNPPISTSPSPPSERLEIDIEDDLPDNGRWDTDCLRGYANVPSDFNCNSEGDGVNFPPEDLNGEVGFWTKCGTVCRINYQVQPEDTKMSFRFYQLNINAMISFDGVTTIITGHNWVEFSKELSGSGIQEVSVTLDRFTPEYYTLLDKSYLMLLEAQHLRHLKHLRCPLHPLTDAPTSTTTESPSSTTTESPSSTTTESPSSTTTDGPTSFETSPTTNQPTTTTVSTSPSPPPEWVEIDIRDDIPNNGRWEFDCFLGYEETPSDFVCVAGRIDFPSEDLNGEVGFWAKCGTRCLIKYIVQPQDVTYSLSLYQKNINAEISFDGMTWNFISGEKWVNYTRYLDGSGIHDISIRLDHFSDDDFVLLDKIIVN